MTVIQDAPTAARPASAITPRGRSTSTEASPQLAVEVADLTKKFTARRSWLGRSTAPAVDAMCGVSFTLSKGEIFGLVGPNGAGKTTLIKTLTTLLEPSSGHARINGFDVVKEQHRVRQLVGLVTSNERSFYWRLTGYENLLFFADLYRLPRRQTQSWIGELVEMLDLSGRIHRRFDGYSTGMRQRLALARGLLNRPGILFMDEPTKGVDPTGSADIIRIIKQQIVPQWHPTILITSHNLSEIEKLCDRIAFMRRGRLVACGTLQELRQAAAPLQRYHLLVRGLSEPCVTALAESAGSVTVEVQPSMSGLELRVELEQGSKVFPHLVRTIVEAGGELLHCTSHTASIDEVFDRIISSDEAAAANPLEDRQ